MGQIGTGKPGTGEDMFVNSVLPISHHIGEKIAKTGQSDKNKLWPGEKYD